MMMMKNLKQPSEYTKQIEEKINKEFPYKKYEGICESIKDLEIKIAFIESKEGREHLIELLGSDAVEKDLDTLGKSLVERKIEKEFVRKFIEENSLS